MAAEPDPSQQGQGPRRLKLVMPGSSDARSSSSQSPNRGQSSSNKASSGSPERPSYSPVTPTLPEAALPDQQPAQTLSRPPPSAEFIDQPEALPVSLDDNPDAIAMRAALSILQMQRQQSLRDIRDLDKMKTAAIEDPEAFVEHLKASKLSNGPRQGVDVDYADQSEEEGENSEPSDPQFPRFPSAQNVVRAPPVEWTKYGIVGEPLDKMHEAQRRYPGLANTPGASQNPQPHQIAGPYKPFSDRLTEARK